MLAIPVKSRILVGCGNVVSYPQSLLYSSPDKSILTASAAESGSRNWQKSIHFMKYPSAFIRL